MGPFLGRDCTIATALLNFASDICVFRLDGLYSINRQAFAAAPSLTQRGEPIFEHRNNVHDVTVVKECMLAGRHCGKTSGHLNQ